MQERIYCTVIGIGETAGDTEVACTCVSESWYLVLTERILLQQVLITAAHLRRQTCRQTGESDKQVDRQVYLQEIQAQVPLNTDRYTDMCTFRMYWPWYSWTQRRSCWGDRCIDRLFFLMDSAISCSGKLSWLTYTQTDKGVPWWSFSSWSISIYYLTDSLTCVLIDWTTFVLIKLRSFYLLIIFKL